MKWKNLTMPKQLVPDPGNTEPLERGFGITLGNALRRVLLSSLQGAAVTAVRIDGVLHEFSTLPGVIEDVTEIILNLKQVRLKLHGDGPKKGTFETRGKGEVRAGDLKVDADVQVLNPDLHIATLNRAAGEILGSDSQILIGKPFQCILQWCQEVQPSITAASYSSSGMFCNPARKIIILRPTPHNDIMIRALNAHLGSSSQRGPWIPA